MKTVQYVTHRHGHLWKDVKVCLIVFKITIPTIHGCFSHINNAVVKYALVKRSREKIVIKCFCRYIFAVFLAKNNTFNV